MQFRAKWPWYTRHCRGLIMLVATGATLIIICSASFLSATDDGTRFRKIPATFQRDSCRTVKTKAGEGCYDLAKRCKISQNDLKKYNSAKDFCTTLELDQRVCCSRGSLPDMTPQPQKDGSCSDYVIKKGDNCYSIGEEHDMEKKDIEDRNKET